jgi:ATP-dependent Clp protease ATP-binding subunit ClpA
MERKKTVPKSKRKVNIGVSDIEDIVAQIARIPSRQVGSDDKSLLKKLEADLIPSVCLRVPNQNAPV